MKVTMFAIIVLFGILEVLAIGPKDCFRPNEVYYCGGACQITCYNYNKICPIINVRCNDMCYCIKNYARDQTGTCVHIKYCKDRLNGKCGDHEEYRLDFYLNNECYIQKLTEIEVSKRKVLGCFCIKGYKRDPSGKCIPAAKCPIQPPPKYPQSSIPFYKF
ncbi:PREDICTED: inducible metalloproteinase inhibitor protein-like [Nicrophorus vespilloides]|uniref:Inducible metalloproteinase inhibitor protein-like n=1 Tax=Nicrophorus vespilloides TaxID=110193 RepID=A0ABM1MH38_NICVS|nr:PREDICTED: inducible metalloproteinase inhibitor protein-like [Nicrophorus vespilloides]